MARFGEVYHRVLLCREQGDRVVESTTFMAIESVLLVCGLVMSYKAYIRRGAANGTEPGARTNAENDTGK